MTRKIYSLEGAIGVGKSTILTELEKLGVKVFPEPVAEWEDGLRAFYRQGANSVGAIELQKLITNSLLNRHEEMLRHSGPKVMERSLNSALGIFTLQNMQSFPHPQWSEPVHAMMRGMMKYETNLEMIAVTLNPDTMIQRTINRGGPEAASNEMYMRQIHRACTDFQHARCKHTVHTDRQSPSVVAKIIYDQILTQ